ncbi:MAG: agmatine deiminase family protein [Deltaproteobacteria bacterium]|nr:agmatine deiminase family protein [Deltaproteobacteria bacterium]
MKSPKKPVTPAQLGYRMPAEWETHAATWLSWPHNDETWPAEMMERIQRFWARMVKELSQGEMVHINVKNERMAKRVIRFLQQAHARLDKVYFHYFPTNDAWVRDHGPIFVLQDSQRQLAVTDWEYNAWGNKYPPFDLDNQIPGQVAKSLRTPHYKTKMVLEGGSIDVNGVGTLLTTEACLLNPNRNPDMSRSEIENKLRDLLGVRQILWLGDGIVGDDTDGHVDDITRFVNIDTIVCVREENPQDENYQALEENYQRLLEMRDPEGNPFRIECLPMPAPLYDASGNRLPASYANFYIANEVVLVPIFKDRNDVKALRILRQLFQGRRVVGLDCREVVVGLGAIHCVTQQQPQVV